MVALMLLVVVGFVAWFILALQMFAWTGQMLGIEECLWGAMLCGAYALVIGLARREIWIAGIAMASCGVLAYVGYATQREWMHEWFRLASGVVLWVTLGVDITKPWWKRRLLQLRNRG